MLGKMTLRQKGQQFLGSKRPQRLTKNPDDNTVLASMPPKDFYFKFGKNLKIIFYFWMKERGGRRKYPNVIAHFKNRHSRHI